MSTKEQLNALCQHYNAILIEETPDAVRIAAVEAPNEQMYEALRFLCDKHIDVEIWPIERLEKWQTLEPSQPSEHDRSSSAVALLNTTLAAAVQQRASDIHFEPFENAYRIRLRIDGVLQCQPLLPQAMAASVTARLKILANLDIAEKRLPQDGQMDYLAEEVKASFRVSTLPCRYGEKVVLRLLQQGKQHMDIHSLGMSEDEKKQLQQSLQAPQGMILVTGPTGSGKTITLYSALEALNQPGINVCSVEDPIEIPQEGLNQTQINPKAGLTFQHVLRALLRQDPDVIMVGEIRDGETAEIAIKAAQTGHLVLSTLHTNSTVETLVRLEQMAIPRWMIASALNIIVAQRLVRKLCPHCKTHHEPAITLPGHIWPSALPNWHPTGCERCYGGYYGRTALFEILPLAAALRQAITQGESASNIESLAREQGMSTLFENGCVAVAQGHTTLEEVYRVLGVPHA
ncbi:MULTISPECIES: type II secretion system protein GspE [unclassified Cedecea]|uniref:type II secretion system protein GspE n=1 Tax=unclassified Cedecea TaxID=2649846 RepID=UPI003017E8E3